MVSTVTAATQKSPTFTLAPNVIPGCTAGTCLGSTVELTITDPATNPYAITAFTVTAPSTWGFTTVLSPVTSTYFTCTVSSTSLACNLLKSTAPLPPGASDTIFGETFTLDVVPPASTSFPVKGTFTTSIQDASSVAYYAGSTFPAWSADPSTAVTVTLSPTTTTYVAGAAPYTVTAAVGGTTSTTEATIPVVWTVAGPGAGTVSPLSGTTSASGTATTTFTPTDDAAAGLNTNDVVATLGNAPAKEGSPFFGHSATVETVPGSPASVLLTFVEGTGPGTGDATAASLAFPSIHYISNDADENATAGVLLGGTTAPFGDAAVYGSYVFYSVADAYSNPVTSGVTLTAALITAAGGAICNLASTICAPQASLLTGANPTAGNLGAASTVYTATVDGVPQAWDGGNYWQSGEYGWAGEITITLTGSYNGASFGTIRSATNKISTSTFASVAGDVKFNDLTDTQAPVVKAPCLTGICVTAGSTFSPRVITDPLQLGVPLTIQVCVTTSCAPTSKDYSGTFPATKAAEFSGLTNSSAELGSPFMVDTVAGTTEQLNATWTFETDSGSVTLTTTPGIPDCLGCSVQTVAGAPAEFVIITGFGAAVAPGSTYAVVGTSIGVDVSLADAYGNAAVAPPSSPEIQIGLTPSSGLLSATSVYIPTGDSSTNATTACPVWSVTCVNAPLNSFGAIYWTLPSAIGTYTLTATGVVSGVAVHGSGTVTTVTATPTFSITSPSIPSAGVIYSSSPTVVFSGEANISLGYSPVNVGPAGCTTTCPTQKVTIAKVGYKINSATSWSNAVVTTGVAAGSYGWDAVAFLTAGLNTVMFNATDSISPTADVYTSPSYSVLVDPVAPVVTFTTANNAALSNGAPATATIVVSEGDLNYSSVVASVNGTALPSSVVKITPATNTLGSPITYTATITLPAGYDILGLSASSLAGLTGTAPGISVTVSVPLDQTFQSSGTGLPTFTTVAGLQGVSVTWTNFGDTPITAQFWVQFTGPVSEGTFLGGTVAPGASFTVFYGTGALSPGSYTALVYVSIDLVPYSAAYTVAFTVP